MIDLPSYVGYFVIRQLDYADEDKNEENTHPACLIYVVQDKVTEFIEKIDYHIDCPISRIIIHRNFIKREYIFSYISKTQKKKAGHVLCPTNYMCCGTIMMHK